MKQKEIIVIGAGIGGLATAIQLARQGLKVYIYEKNSRPGGRCQQIYRQGHIFDNGPTMYLFPEIYSNFFSSVGEEVNKHLKLIRIEPLYKLNFPDNTNIVLSSNLRKMRTQLENIEHGSYEKYLSYLKNTKKFYDVVVDRIITKSLTNSSEYFNFKNFNLLFKTGALANHYLFSKKYFKHPNLNAAFTFQDSYLSLNPFQSPAIYSLFTYSEVVNGNYLPQGGMYKVILALETIAKKYGIKIFYNNPVNKINIHENRAISVTLKSGKVKSADYIVANADLSFVYQHLLPKEPFTQKLLRKKYSCSAIVFHWGLDKIYPQLKTHNLFFSESYRGGFEQVINHSVPPDNPHFYIQAPCRVDLTRAPKNEDTVSVIVPINHINPANTVDWKKYKYNVRKYIINRLIKAGLVDLGDHIKFEISYTPDDWQNSLNLTYGAIYGLHHNLAQLGYLRPQRRHNKYKNLYFVGASNHPGSGLPTVLLSSQFTSRMILEQINS